MKYRFGHYILPAISLVFFIFCICQKTDYSPDDTYIYMQYAKNIAAGNGFSFNPGESSYGVTSPLWVLILTIPYLAGIDGYWFSKIIDILSALAAMFVFFRFTRYLFTGNKLLQYAATSVFILNAWFVRWAFTGMETSFAVLLVLIVFYLYYSEKYSFMFLAGGLLYLTRPESLLLIIILFGFTVLKRLREKKLSMVELLKFVVFVLIPVLPYLIYAKFSFGSMMPNTALGKSTLTFNGGIIIAQLTEIAKTLAGAGLIEMILGIVFILTLIRKKDFKGTLPLIAWIAGLSVLYIVTDADIISRYLLIISPFIIILGFKAIEQINKKQFAAAILLFVICVFYSQFIFYKFVKPSTDDFTVGMNECLIPIGVWLGENSPPGSRVLVNDVGAVGYFSGRYIIDAAALINRDLELNRKIMATPLEDRMETHRLLKFIEADYVIDRDTSELSSLSVFEKYELKLELKKKFPSLGISDATPRFYKVYKVTKKVN